MKNNNGTSYQSSVVLPVLHTITAKDGKMDSEEKRKSEQATDAFSKTGQQKKSICYDYIRRRDIF